jgi:hypothetical protein
LNQFGRKYRLNFKYFRVKMPKRKSIAAENDKHYKNC